MLEGFLRRAFLQCASSGTVKLSRALLRVQAGRRGAQGVATHTSNNTVLMSWLMGLDLPEIPEPYCFDHSTSPPSLKIVKSSICGTVQGAGTGSARDGEDGATES